MNRQVSTVSQLSAYEKLVASRMIISLNDFSQRPVTELTPSLKQLIQQTEVAGVILFASNFVSLEQTVKLTYELQSARADGTLPLIISIDQEGGRVTRLPSHFATSFSGNMSIGATYPTSGTEFAKKVGSTLAKELSALGINVNFAPTLDTNTNPDNPVINVRSFGDNTDSVAELGCAMVDAIQAHGVATAIKHFPGHGDTDVDSHTGLPCVARSLAELMQSDLLPFKAVCQRAKPAMVMTAHIQFPKIDATYVASKDNTSVIVPATMSDTILQGILREQLQYKGVIITDALDMAGVADHFDPVSAVVETFKAGADIALMPYKDTLNDSVTSFKQFIREVAERLFDEGVTEVDMQQACQRIQEIRAKYALDNTSLADKISQAVEVFADERHDLLEAELAENAITLIGNHSALPLKYSSKIIIVANDSIQANVLGHELAKYSDRSLDIMTSCWSDLSTADCQTIETRILLVDYGYHSPVLEHSEQQMIDYASVTKQHINAILDANGINIVVAMQSPYDIVDYLEQSDAALFCYHGVLTKHNNTFTNNTVSALAKVLIGRTLATGILPVRLKRSD